MKLAGLLQQWGTEYMAAPEQEKAAVMIRVLDIEKTVTMKAAVSKEARSFNQLTRTDGINRTALLNAIGTYFSVMLNTYFGDKSPSMTQIVLFADEFINIQNLGIEDALLFIKGIKTGQYGKTYGKVDIPTLNEWLDAYLEARNEAYDKARKMEHQFEESSPRESSLPGYRNYDKHIGSLFGKHVKRGVI